MSVVPEHIFAEDIDGVWHVRRDDYWDNDAMASVRSHAACGVDIWSCHVSAFPPILIDKTQRHCRGCFPLGRRRRMTVSRPKGEAMTPTTGERRSEP